MFPNESPSFFHRCFVARHLRIIHIYHQDEAQLGMIPTAFPIKDSHEPFFHEILSDLLLPPTPTKRVPVQRQSKSAHRTSVRAPCCWLHVSWEEDPRLDVPTQFRLGIGAWGVGLLALVVRKEADIVDETRRRQKTRAGRHLLEYRMVIVLVFDIVTAEDRPALALVELRVEFGMFRKQSGLTWPK